MNTRLGNTPSSPYIVGSPLKGKDMFYGRDDVFQTVYSHLIGQYQNNVVAIYGQPRTGKTSILYQMKRRLNEHGDFYVPILIDVQGLSPKNTDNFLCDIARETRRLLKQDYQLLIESFYLCSMRRS